MYDQYYGDTGRDINVPSYNLEDILNSATNKAIGKLQKPLTKENINTLRKQLDISWCRKDSYQPHLVCTDFCLFDLDNDPCETKNLVNNVETKSFVTQLNIKLEQFWNEIVPAKKIPTDLLSNPEYCNNTWFTWLDGLESCVLSH